MNSELRKFQSEELELLKEVSACLKNEGINFYLIGGCSIGALRHKGFIPWDDDVDMGIMRRDFERAEKALLKLKGELMYDPVESHKIPDAPLGHVYKLGCASLEEAPRLDIFPIDNIPDNKLLEKYQKLCAKIYHVCILRRPAENRGRLNKILTTIICKCFPNFLLNFLQKIAYKGVTRWMNKETEYVSNLYGVSGDREKVPARFFGTPRYVPFEDMLIPIPEFAEEYNTHIYGNFMELPPVEKRVPSHFKFNS